MPKEIEYTEYNIKIELSETEYQHLQAYFNDNDEDLKNLEEITEEAYHYDNNSWHGVFPNTAADILCQTLNQIREIRSKNNGNL